MNHKNLEQLDFFRVREIVSSFAMTQEGNQTVLSILPSFLNFKIIIFNSHNYYGNSFDTWIPKRPKFKQIELEKNITTNIAIQRAIQALTN